MGGLVTPLLAGRLPVVGLVFVCALVPRPGRSATDVVADEPTFSAGWSRRSAAQVTHPDGSTSWPAERASEAIEAMYHDCDPGVAAAAAAMLRPQCWGPFDEPSPLTAWPSVPAAWVLTTDDRVVDPRQQRARAAEHGGTLVELPGGHCPMLSRPDALADAIAGFARSVEGTAPSV
jgi:pimeloyl-ACP methyl ester carboxylesterase